MAKIRVLVADDHTIVRQGIVSLLTDSGEVEVVAEAADGLDAVEQAVAVASRTSRCSTSRCRASPGSRRCAGCAPSCRMTRTLVLTVHEEEEYVLPIVRAGASGYLVKDSAVGRAPGRGPRPPRRSGLLRPAGGEGPRRAVPGTPAPPTTPTAT